MKESNFNKFWNLSSIWYFQKYFLTTNLNIYKIYWFYRLDLWISYKIMPLFASFEQKFKIKKMPKLGCPNCFIVNKLKENVALPIKGCVIWWLRHLDASMRSWAQIQATHVHEFVYLVMYIHVHMVQGRHSWVPTNLPFYHITMCWHMAPYNGATWQNIMWPHGNI